MVFGVFDRRDQGDLLFNEANGCIHVFSLKSSMYLPSRTYLLWLLFVLINLIRRVIQDSRVNSVQGDLICNRLGKGIMVL